MITVSAPWKQNLGKLNCPSKWYKVCQIQVIDANCIIEVHNNDLHSIMQSDNLYYILTGAHCVLKHSVKFSNTGFRSFDPYKLVQPLQWLLNNSLKLLLLLLKLSSDLKILTVQTPLFQYSEFSKVLEVGTLGAPEQRYHSDMKFNFPKFCFHGAMWW